MNAMWLSSLAIAHRIWAIPFGLLAVATFGMLAYSMMGKRPLASHFLLWNRVFLVSLDMQWMLGVLHWAVGQQWQGTSPLVAFRHPILMTAVWIMYRYGNRKMKAAAEEQTRIRDGFAYYLLSGAFTIVGVWQILNL